MDWLSFAAGFVACILCGVLIVVVLFAIATKAANDLGDWPEEVGDCRFNDRSDREVA